MLKIVGLLTLSAIGAITLVFIDREIGAGYLNTFIQTSSLELMGILLGLNLATASSLVVGLTNIEVNIGKSVFDNTIKEIKSNIIFMIISFLINIVVIISMPQPINEITSSVHMILEVISTIIFSLYMYAFYEMTMAVFSMEKSKKTLLKK